MRLVGLIPVTFAAMLLASCDGEAAKQAAEAAAVPAPKLEDLPAPYNTADLARGKALQGRKCGACHFVQASRGNQVGPNLHGVFERGVAKADKYNYSPALKAFAEPKWTPELLDQWLLSPDSFVPGTAMRLNGITDETERRDIIAYLLIASRE
ncbi:MAG: c-type cytochrome [Novosphingobium sp.]|nr:c-type cytochrome [Novosphingobium sp.]